MGRCFENGKYLSQHTYKNNRKPNPQSIILGPLDSKKWKDQETLSEPDVGAWNKRFKAVASFPVPGKI